jgi:hypothetical protein
MMEILILLFLLQVKHCYADFFLQTYIQTVKKGVWLDPIGISHTTEHMYCSLVVLVGFGFFIPISATAMILAIIVEGVVHYLVDYSKVKYGCKDNTAPAYWRQFGFDQLAHQVTYILMAWYLLVA